MRHATLQSGGRLRRRGSVIVEAAVILPVLLGFAALAVDIGYIAATQAKLEAVAESAGLAAASGLSTSRAEARRRAIEYAAKNIVDGHPVVLEPQDIEFGVWYKDTKTFTPVYGDTGYPTAVRLTPRLVASRGTGVGLFFARMFGWNTVDMSASAVAVFGARDIMLVLDYSASMNYDSQLQHAPILGLSAIRASLKNIWDDLALHIPLDLDNNGVYDSTLQFEPRRITATNNSTILRQLGLQRTPYPYPSGSWGDYFNYVKGNESVWRAGYRYYYGGLTLMDYLQSQRPAANQTPDLWKAREQPLTAVKDAVLVFLSYMQQYPTDDKVGLASYTYTDGRGKLEVPLTANYDLVETTSRHRQAAHYHTYTNIAGGMERARQELENNGREGTLKVMVLLSDGHTNWTKSNSYNPTRARREAIDEADMAADIKLPIVTISLGADADTDLMQEIADITKGVHFIVPGGKDVNNYREDLFFIFSLIAADKSLKLVY